MQPFLPGTLSQKTDPCSKQNTTLCRVRPDTGSAAGTLSEGGSRARIGTVAAHTAGSISHTGRLQAVSLGEAAALVEAHTEQAAAGEEPDTLPGLVLLTERWLTKVCRGACRLVGAR